MRQKNKKYIRTEDGIYESKKYCEMLPIEIMGINEEPICPADTIKELCDCYFAISNTGYKTPIKIDFDKKIIYQWQDNNLVVDYTFEQFIPYHTIYGAILTDKGLIFVVKMNDKGDLELL